MPKDDDQADQERDEEERPKRTDKDRDHPGRPQQPSQAATGPPWTALLGLQAFGNEATTELLRSSETTACYLDQIAQHTCGIYNEAHWQTDLQRDLRADVQAVKDFLESAFPTAALERARHGEAQRRLEECCPPPKPEPTCEPRPCPPGAERGEHALQHGEAAAVRVEGAPYPPFEIAGEAAEGRNLDHYPIVPAGPLRGSLAPVVPALDIRDYQGGAGSGGAANPVHFYVDTPVGSKVSFSGFPPDMSGASGSDVVMMSGNTWAAYPRDLEGCSS